MDLHIELTGDVPLRRQLERALRDAIRSGRLVAGSTLPPTRILAEELGVSRGVVVDSYAQLAAEGYLATQQGSGTRVAFVPSPPPVPRRETKAPPRVRFDLRPGLADLHGFPRARWQAAVTRALRETPDARLTYPNAQGFPELRRALAEYLARARAAIADPDDVVVACSSAHAMSTLWRVLHRRGARRVAVEDPGWHWQRLTVERAGLEAVPIEVDEHGLVVSRLDEHDLDAVVLTAAHQYPTGVVLSPERRTDLIAWARRTRSLVVEDDYDAEYRYDREPVASLQGLAPDVVVYCGTASKTLAPALRLAWLVAPDRLIDALTDELRITGANPPALDQAALARFVGDSELDRHLRRMRRQYRGKRAILLAELHRHLPGVTIGGAAAGLHLLAWLPDGADERSIGAAARASGVAVHELHRHCAVFAPQPPALLLGYAFPTVSELRAAMRLLAIAAR